MKNRTMKFILTVFLFISVVVARAQDDAISRLFRQYEGDENFTTIYITSKMFSLIAQIPEQEDEQDFMNIIRRLTGIRILTSDSLPDADKLYQKTANLLVKNGFEDLMVIKDGAEETKFLVHEKGEVISEFVMVSGEKNDFTLISLTGDLRLKDISKISKTMDIKGFDKLDKVKDKQ